MAYPTPPPGKQYASHPQHNGSFNPAVYNHPPGPTPQVPAGYPPLGPSSFHGQANGHFAASHELAPPLSQAATPLPQQHYSQYGQLPTALSSAQGPLSASQTPSQLAGGAPLPTLSQPVFLAAHPPQGRPSSLPGPQKPSQSIASQHIPPSSIPSSIPGPPHTQSSGPTASQHQLVAASDFGRSSQMGAVPSGPTGVPHMPGPPPFVAPHTGFLSAPGGTGAPPKGIPLPGAAAAPPQPGFPAPISGISQTALPPGSGNMNQPGLPPGSGNMNQPGFPLGSGNMNQPGFPPGSGNMNQRGFPPGPGGMNQPGFPPGPGGMNQPGFPPGPGGMNQPGFPPGLGGPGGMNQSGFPPGLGGPGTYPQGPGMPQQRQQRLDPNLMPSVVQLMEDDLARSGLFPTGQPYAEAPPLTTTDFYVQDQGNANPRMMRCSLYVAPASGDILKTTQLPFVFAVSPFVKLDQRERPPPLVDYENGPVRCGRCKAYMCPFMEFVEGGTRFRCPFCTATTTVDQWYFAHLDHMGRRSDYEHRPELYYGAYDYTATKQYCKDGIPPKEPAFIFIIDVSYNAVNSGMLEVVCKNLESILDTLPKETGAVESVIHIGLATFDSAIHFFDLSSLQPSMLVVSDVEDVFVPIVDGLLLPLSKARSSLRAVLAELPSLFGANRNTTPILGPAVQAGLDALKCAGRAGKLFVIATTLPTAEAPGKLKPREDRKLLGTEKEKMMLTPQCEFYTKLGEQCVKGAASVDLFLFPNSFIDVATIAQLSAVTGGSVFKYQYFEAAKDASRFLYDLQHDISKQIAFDAIVRLRSSAGIRPVAFSGSFYMENTTDMEMASIDEDKAFFAEIRHDDTLSGESAVVQAAILYTSVAGRRLLRILNVCLPVSSDYNQLYRVADHETICAYLLKNAVELNREKGQREMREILAARAAKMLAAYREKCSVQSPLGQLILPESLKLLPLYMNSIMKHDALAGGNELTVDDKAWMLEVIRGVRVEEAMRLLYPRIVSLSIAETSETEVLPPVKVRASLEFLQTDTAYLVDNGIVLFVWIGLNVPSKWVQDVFGVTSVALIDTESHCIPEKDNDFSRAARLAISSVEGGSRKKKLFLIREKESLEQWMRKFLVEDKTGPAGMSYVDFLCYIHKEIRNLLS